MLHNKKMGMGLHGDEANVSVSYHVTYPSQPASCLFEISTASWVRQPGDEKQQWQNVSYQG